MSARLDAVVDGLLRIGLQVRETDTVTDAFLPRVRIRNGGLEVAPGARISDVLHESGHLAVMPDRFRKYLDGDLRIGIERAFAECSSGEGVEARALLHADEQAATAWAFAFGASLGLPAERVIEDRDYQGDGASQRLALSVGRHAGIQALRGGGMCAMAYETDSLQWPVLRRWVQP